MRSHSALLALLTALLLAPGTVPPKALASVVAALDLEALVKEADDVVLARIIAQKSLYDDRGRIVTDYTVQVERTEKGDSTPGAALTVRKLGGVVEGRGMRVAGEPSFEIGERVVLFGKRGGRRYLRTVGMAQGAMRVYERDGEKWTEPSSQGLSLVQDKARGGSVAPPAPRKLEELLSDVRAIVARHK